MLTAWGHLSTAEPASETSDSGIEWDFNRGVGQLGRARCSHPPTDHDAAQEDHNGNDSHRHEHEDELFSVQLYLVNALV